jgi:hypothetical protein
MRKRKSHLVVLSFIATKKGRDPLGNNPTSVGATTKRLRVIHLVERLLPIRSVLKWVVKVDTIVLMLEPTTKRKEKITIFVLVSGGTIVSY